MYKIQGVSFVMPLERMLSRNVSEDTGILLDKAAISRDTITGEI
jgi:hypothetical protein